MEWLVPFMLIVAGAMSIGAERLLRHYLSQHCEARLFQKRSYYSAQELADRFARRLPLSWAMIGFGVFWTLSNFI